MSLVSPSSLSSLSSRPAPPLTLRLHAQDNVLVAQCALVPGTTLPGEAVTVRAAIPAGHKVAARPIAKDEPVRRYGQIIGFASRDIGPGEHVHTQNVEMRDF